MTSETVVKVDDSMKPNYPSWMKRVLRPDLEAPLVTLVTGELDVKDLFSYFDESQKDYYGATGQMLYSELVRKGQIFGCLGLIELEAIKTKGTDFFRKHFGENTTVFGWRSVIVGNAIPEDGEGSLYVPGLNTKYGPNGGEVGVNWQYMGYLLGSKSPVVRRW
ncbi:MAG TPA: hypothetical protein VI953_04240 [Candidatus Paceibacterota bacterium]